MAVSDKPRVDTVSRIILATPHILFKACLDKETLSNWRAPDGMESSITDFDPRVGGGYEMVLRYLGSDAEKQGKSAPGEDRVRIRFTEIIPDKLIEEEVRFMGDDPALAPPMKFLTRFVPVTDGTKVMLEARDVPASVAAADHRAGLHASLRKLALLAE